MVAAGLLVAASVAPKVYRNEEFGITLPVPRDVVLCVNPPTEHDDGALLLLGTTDANRCQEPNHDHERSIDVFASYPTDDTSKLPDLLGLMCDAPCEQPPGVWQIAGLRTEAGETTYPDGSIDILVVTQAGKPNPAFDPTAPSINYTLTLHTGTKNLAEDLQVFRAVLQTIRLVPSQEEFSPK